MNYLTATEYRSKLPYAQDVVFKIKKITHGNRMAFNDATADLQTRLATVGMEIAHLQDTIKEAENLAEIEPCTCDHDDHGPHDEKTGRCSHKDCPCRKPDIADNVWTGLATANKLQFQYFIFELCPALIRWGVKSISGLKMDGVDATVDIFLAEGPEELIHEIGLEINKMSRLTPQELAVFEQPTTSGAPVAGQTSDTTAQSANETNSTSLESARSTSQT